jgi:hypothetical protein
MNNEDHLSIKKLFRKKDGIAFTGTAVVIAVLLAFVALFLRNHVSVNTAATADLYSSTQAFWGAISGIDHIVETAAFDIGNTVTTYDFSPTEVVVTTTLINLPIDSTYQVTSTGTHGGHLRSLTFLMEPPTPFDNTFFDIDSTDNWGYTAAFECSTSGLPGGRYWGSSCISCPGESYGFQQPLYVLDSTYLPLKDPLDPSLGHICYWLGRKEQNPKIMYFNTIEDMLGTRNVEITLWLGAGVDVPDVPDQSDFQQGDEFEIYANGVLVEKWTGPSGEGPMSPTIDASVGDLQPQFHEYTFNLSYVLGSFDTLSIGFVGNTNSDDKYSGFSGVTLSYDLDWIIDVSSIHEE